MIDTSNYLFTTDRSGAAYVIHLGDHSYSPDWITGRAQRLADASGTR